VSLLLRVDHCFFLAGGEGGSQGPSFGTRV
jgi:hypothetical protein